MSSHLSDDFDALFASARADGLSHDTLDLVVANLNGPTMIQPIGAPLSSLAANELTLAMNIIDRSGSMAPHAAALIRAYNEDYLAMMRQTPLADDVLVSTILFNDRVELYHGFVALDDAPPLTRRHYRPDRSTALYDAVAGGLTNLVLYAQQLRQSGVQVQGLVIVYSDGDDNASQQQPDDLRRAARELLRQEIYSLAYVGFRDGPGQDGEVRQMAGRIGFSEALLASLSPADLRRIFRLASLSTLRLSRQPAGGAPTFR